MTRLTKKDSRILVLLNDFGYLDESFFMILFHSKATQARHKIVFKVRACLYKLIKIGFVSTFESFEDVNFYSLTAAGRSHLFFIVNYIYPNNLVVNNGKFFHSRLCSHVYAKIAANYNIQYQSENCLLKINNTDIVPDLAVKFDKTVVYFEVERSRKSEVLIKEKLSVYASRFKNGYVIYLTGDNSIIKIIDKLKHAYPNYQRIRAFDLKKFLNDPKFFLDDVELFSIRGSSHEVSINMQ